MKLFTTKKSTQELIGLGMALRTDKETMETRIRGIFSRKKVRAQRFDRGDRAGLRAGDCLLYHGMSSGYRRDGARSGGCNEREQAGDAE